MGESEKQAKNRGNLEVLEKVEIWREQAENHVATFVLNIKKLKADLHGVGQMSGDHLVSEHVKDGGSQLEESLRALEVGTNRLEEWKERVDKTHEAVRNQKFHGKSKSLGLD